MGCANSKQKKCRHCQTPYSPVPRSYSMHVHHPPQSKGDSYHVVALTSTTLGSLKLEIEVENNDINGVGKGEEQKNINGNGISDNGRKEFSMGLIEAKTWSNMMNDKIPKIVPKTPIVTTPGEPETINTWELMEGLEDHSPLRSPNHIRSFSFDVVPNPVHAHFDRPKSRLQENGILPCKPMWVQISDDDSNSKSSVISELDPEIISSFRKSLQELPADDPFHLRPLENGKQSNYKLEGKDKVVVYFTSLRGVRKTYEDCCHVRVILKSLGLCVDERDVSMHSGFKEELKELLGSEFNKGGLPRVFMGRKYVGGAEEIRRMHEEGQLERLLEGCEMVDDGGGGDGACEGCGDIRFVPCETCWGSCKIYHDAEEEQEEGSEEGEYGFQRCPDCNENGLIRCPVCCY